MHSGILIVIFNFWKVCDIYVVVFQEPKMFVRYWDDMHTSSCQVLSNQRMECPFPTVPVLDQQISPEEPLSLDYGFLLDDVQSVCNLSHSPNFPKLLLYPDPVYEKFNEGVWSKVL